jgi:hypothetical protein
MCNALAGRCTRSFFSTDGFANPRAGCGLWAKQYSCDLDNVAVGFWNTSRYKKARSKAGFWGLQGWRKLSHFPENLTSHRFHTFAGMDAFYLQFLETKCKLPQIVFDFFKQKHSRLEFLKRFNQVLLVIHKRSSCLRYSGKTIDSVYCFASVLKGCIKISNSHDVSPMQLHCG